ncbi:uncharacterized protein LOC111298055 [Durio zibethinus]|uniref:Uncharacterized protein LOC111298055 n=1 Tax=Durio zibethinus TaxID=66656 RepID=A0A6P5Z7K0_DURZI|nr:uncharacterized protein LOC111298055 [Durio zibethinus]
MSSKRSVLQEFQFPEASRNIKKVDIAGFRLIETAKDAPRQREEEEKPERFESKCDLRKSLAWDSAFFTSPGVLDPEELFETLNIHDGDNGLKEASALPSESMAASRIGECIARRSLAWDTAFFTSAGVLDPEELSMVNKGYKKSETHTLPGIEEEFWKSAESNSTMGSDYSLASLEIDLFDDMKTSMQKSSKAYNMVNSSCKLEIQKGIPKPHSSKRLDATSSVRIKPLPVSRTQKISANGVAKTANEAINPPQAQHATRRGEPDSSSSAKLSKGFSQANPLSSATTKRASLGANNMKVNKIRKAVPGRNMVKKPFGDYGSFIPSSTPSPEPASSCFHIASRDLSGSACGQIASMDKSPNSLRRNNGLAASYSNDRTPIRSLTRHECKQIDSSQPTDLLSTPKSSSTSVSSSIDCWSSESSASVNHGSNKFTKSLDNAFNRGVPVNNSQGSDTEKCSSDQPFVRKPSGLRLPSPKIGFFDVENSGALTPNGGLKFHSGMQNASKIRSGTNHINGTPNKVKYGKIQPPRTSTRTASVKEKKLGCLQTGNQSFRGIKPNCAGQFTVSGTIRSSLATSSKAETDVSCESSYGYGSKTNGSGSYLKGKDKGKTQPGNKEHVTQIVKMSSVDQNEDTSALNRDGNENLFDFENQVNVLTKQVEAIDFNGALVIEF